MAQNEVVIVVRSDDQTRQGFASSKREAGGLGDKLKSVGKAGGLALAAGVAAGALIVKDKLQESVDAASNLGESVNAVNQVFKGQAGVIKKWGEQNAASFGLSTRAFNELATPLGAGLKNAGFSLKDTSKWTIDLTKRASDMASVFNTDVSEAMEAVQAGLRGEADPLEKFGVGLSAAKVQAEALAETGKKNASALTDQELMTARLNLIMKQTKDTAGDFQRTSDGLANSQRVSAAEVENLQAEIGEKMLPMVQKWNQAKLQLVSTLNDKLVPAMDGLMRFVDGKLMPGLGQLKDSFLKGVREGMVGVRDAIADNRPQLEWLAENLKELGKKIWPIVVEGAKLYGKWITFVIESSIRTIGRLVDAYLFLKENVSSVLAAGVTAWQVFFNGVTGIIRNILESFRAYARAADVVFGTNTERALDDAIASFDRFAKNTNRKTQDAIDTLRRFQREAQSDRNKIKIQASISQLVSQVAAAKKRLATIPKSQKIRYAIELSGYALAMARLAVLRAAAAAAGMAHGGIVGAMAHGGIQGAQGGGPRTGLTMVGESGRELVKLAPGSQVHSNPDTERMLAQRGQGGNTYIALSIAGRDLGEVILGPLMTLVQTNRALRAEIRRAAA